MDTLDMTVTGWTIALPLLHLAGFLLAFLAGGLVAVRVGKRRPARAMSPRSASAPVEASNVLRFIPAATPVQANPAVAAMPGLRNSGMVFCHEMKNYLCAIRGNARLLRTASQGKDQSDIIDRIDQVVSRMESLGWKEKEAPDIIASKSREAVDPIAAAQSCCRLHFAERDVEFGFEASGIPLWVEGDPQRLEQVFRNLYGNALEAGATRIFTRFRRIGTELEIAIEDNGRGCAPEAAARIFEPFFTTKAVGAGQVRGLGLFIVQNIVENHHGRIRATAKNGRGDAETGLVIYLHLPLWSPVAAMARPANLGLRAQRVPLAPAA